MSTKATKLPPVMLGGDPEFFLKDPKTNKIVPSCGIIGGDKGAGIPLGDTGASWLEDNVAVELNFLPASSGAKFVARLVFLIDLINNELGRKALAPEFNLASHKFHNSELAHPKASVFGCDPDFCAYNEKPEVARQVDCTSFSTERYCGGHLHLSFDNRDKIPLWAIAMLMDTYVALPMVQNEEQRGRRRKYGLAGLFRPKPYGIEYRTLSNRWLANVATYLSSERGAHRDLRAMWLENFALSVRSIGVAIQNDPLLVSRLFTRLPVRDIQTAINTENKAMANELYEMCKHFKEARDLELYCNIGRFV